MQVGVVIKRFPGFRHLFPIKTGKYKYPGAVHAMVWSRKCDLQKNSLQIPAWRAAQRETEQNEQGKARNIGIFKTDQERHPRDGDEL